MPARREVRKSVAFERVDESVEIDIAQNGRAPPATIMIATLSTTPNRLKPTFALKKVRGGAQSLQHPALHVGCSCIKSTVSFFAHPEFKPAPTSRCRVRARALASTAAWTRLFGHTESQRASRAGST
jgi:hypothetical protein